MLDDVVVAPTPEMKPELTTPSDWQGVLNLAEVIEWGPFCDSTVKLREVSVGHRDVVAPTRPYRRPLQ